MRSAANSHVKMAKVSRGIETAPIQVYSDQDLLMQKLSLNQPVYIDMVQERSRVF